MWEILFGYTLEKIFGAHTDAFEVGNVIVQTTDDGTGTSSSTGQVSLATNNDVDYHDHTLVCSRPDELEHRPGIQIGFNPFTPIIVKGAEELLKIVNQDPYEKGEVY